MNKELLKDIVILYIEDDEEIREFTSKTIATIVKKVIIANNGAEGLEKFNENNDINLILTDINMPKVDGIEMCEEIRKINKEIPIIITSAHTDPLFLKRSLDINVSAYAMKPIDLYKLAENICKAYEPIYLRKQLEDLKTSNKLEIEEKIKETKYILDTQKYISFITKNETLIEVNNKFLEFFNCKNIEMFNLNHKNILQLFENTNGFIGSDFFIKNKNWIEEINKMGENHKICKIILPNNSEYIFSISINSLFNIEEYFIITLIDITDTIEKSTLIEYHLNHDDVTGLFNNYKSTDILEKEIRRDLRYGNDLSLILFEVDQYKDNNALKDISKILLENVREHDTVSRWKDNQFLAILPQTNEDGAKIVAQKIEAAINCNEKISKVCFGTSQLINNDNETSIVSRASESLESSKYNCF